MEYELIATSTFGVEAILKKEIKNLGFEITDSRNGRITFKSDERGLVRANLWLRTADRVYIKLFEFKSETFEELFQNTKKVNWHEYFPADANFTVVGTSARSTLHSVPACQSIIEKAIISEMGEHYNIQWFDKTGIKFTVRFMFQDNECVLMLDSSGIALHKRGYRVKDVAAPIKETMASALVQLSYFDKNHVLADPMCGSGTIAIEAAMLAENIAPGLGREFDAMNWPFIPSGLWKDEKQKAFSEITYPDDVFIFASDIDQKTLDYARKNAMEAGVDDIIKFSVRDVKYFRTFKLEGLQNDDGSVRQGCIVSNPPYGQRIGEQEAIKGIYETLRYFKKSNPGWELNIITPDKTFEKIMKKQADKRRKLYNGNIESCYYQYFGKSE